MARHAVGVLDAGRAAQASARRSYAADLEEQIRAKKEATRQARAESREAAARAQGLLSDPAEAARRKKAQYAADLDAQMRAKQVLRCASPPRMGHTP